MDFSFGILPVQGRIFYPKKSNEFKWHSYLYTFRNETWISVMCYIFVTGITIIVFEIAFRGCCKDQRPLSKSVCIETFIGLLIPCINISLRAIIGKRCPMEPEKNF